MYTEKKSYTRVDEKDVYEFIVKYTKKYLYPPTIYELAGACNCHYSTIKKRLLKLQSLGLIKVKRQSSRAITLLDFCLNEK